MAALIQRETGIEPELVEGGRGEFTAWVGEARVAQKTALGFPSDDEIRESLSGNLCRCTGYAKIFDAVRIAAERA